MGAQSPGAPGGCRFEVAGMTPARKAAHPDVLLSSRDLAAMLGVAMVTLSRWRSQRKGPPFLYLGPKRAAYRLGAVRQWLDVQSGTAQ